MSIILQGRPWKCPGESKCLFDYEVCDCYKDCKSGQDESMLLCSKRMDLGLYNQKCAQVTCSVSKIRSNLLLFSPFNNLSNRLRL